MLRESVSGFDNAADGISRSNCIDRLGSLYQDLASPDRELALSKVSDENVMPFWRRKTLSQMTKKEWESLCDGCGRCCLIKLEDEDTGEIHLTSLSCRLLDTATCRCKDYENRHDLMPDCIALTPKTVRSLSWLPKTCGYRRVAEGRDLAWWHPLISGTPKTVAEAGISVTGWVKSEVRVKELSYERYIIDDFDKS